MSRHLDRHAVVIGDNKITTTTTATMTTTNSARRRHVVTLACRHAGTHAHTCAYMQHMYTLSTYLNKQRTRVRCILALRILWKSNAATSRCCWKKCSIHPSTHACIQSKFSANNFLAKNLQGLSLLDIPFFLRSSTLKHESLARGWAKT